MWRTIHKVVIGLLAIGTLGTGYVFAQTKPAMPPDTSMTKPATPPATMPAPPTTGTTMEKSKTVPKTMETPTTGLVDVNTADEATLTSLKGIGPVKAKAIIKYRQEHGGFKTVDELKNVHGIGDKTLETLRPIVTVGKMTR